MKEEKKAINEIENINDLQKKILGFCITARRANELTMKFDKNQGYIYSLCMRMVGRKLLIKETFPPNKTYYKTNQEIVKV